MFEYREYVLRHDSKPSQLPQVLTGGKDVLEDSVVHGVQILDVEGGERQRAVELFREQTDPRVVSHEDHSLPWKHR